MANSTSSTLRLPVSRHLQDFNGYCGPACALMVIEFTGSAKSPPVFAQNEYFKQVRTHAKQAKDRRPVKSPAESLLSMLNDHTAGETEWIKIFNPETHTVAQTIVQAIEGQQQPCLMLVSRGMHWVVAFGLQRKDDGSPAGLLMRDPAWAGMPRFYGLSIFPETPAIEHSLSPCPCLSHTDNPPGAVHERFITMDELISGRGLQGAPDWEGHGAIALVPEGSNTIAAPALAITAPAAEAVENPKEKAGQAALDAVRENGLYGRPDSPADWDAALKDATAGDPILVKNPEHAEDNFYLVPLVPSAPKAKHGAWAMLDSKTLALREVSLLENWKVPAFPSQNSGDVEKAAKQQHTLADGSSARFKKEDLKPNTKNLIWAPSDASALPYWPVKELTAPHPSTGEPVSIYVNQEGDVYNHLLPDHVETPKPSHIQSPPKSGLGKSLAIGTALCAAAAGLYFWLQDPNKEVMTDKVEPNETAVKERFRYRRSLYLSQYSDITLPHPHKTSPEELMLRGLHTFSDSKFIYIIVHKVKSQCKVRGTLNQIDITSMPWELSTDVKSWAIKHKTSLLNIKPTAYKQIVKTTAFNHTVPVTTPRKKTNEGLKKELSINAQTGGVYILRTPISSLQK